MGPKINTITEAERINMALRVEATPHRTEGLSKEDLQEMAKRTNSAWVHCSANCTLLAACLLKNLKNSESFASCSNTFPLIKAVNPAEAARIVFGESQKLTPVASHVFDISGVEEAVLRSYNKTGDRSYIIRSYGYIVPFFGKCGHDFNAVVVTDNNQNPSVQFVDAWRSSSPTPTSSDLTARCSRDARYDVLRLEKVNKYANLRFLAQRALLLIEQ